MGATYPSKTIQSIFACKMAENCAIQFPFRVNLSTSVIHCRCAGDPLGQIDKSFATGDYVAGRLAGYENQA